MSRFNAALRFSFALLFLSLYPQVNFTGVIFGDFKKEEKKERKEERKKEEKKEAKRVRVTSRDVPLVMSFSH